MKGKPINLHLLASVLCVDWSVLLPKFTRGPWAATLFQGQLMIEARGRLLAVIISQKTVSGEEARANAELIASAPKLYEALDNLMVSSYDPDEGDCLICGAECAWGAGSHDGDCEVAAAAAVLATARGEVR